MGHNVYLIWSFVVAKIRAETYIDFIFNVSVKTKFENFRKVKFEINEENQKFHIFWHLKNRIKIRFEIYMAKFAQAYIIVLEFWEKEQFLARIWSALQQEISRAPAGGNFSFSQKSKIFIYERWSGSSELASRWFIANETAVYNARLIA